MKLTDAITLIRNTKKDFNRIVPGQMLFVESNGTIVRGIAETVSVNWQRIARPGISLGQFFESAVNDFSSEAEVTIRLRMPTVVRGDINATAKNKAQCLGSTAWMC